MTQRHSAESGSQTGGQQVTAETPAQRPSAPSPRSAKPSPSATGGDAAATQDGASPYRRLDEQAHQALTRVTAGVSPASISQAYADWWTHLALSPGSQASLTVRAQCDALRFARYVARSTAWGTSERCTEPLPDDKRFQEQEWDRWPFNVLHQGFLLTEQWWAQAMTGVPGVNAHHEGVTRFVTRQLLDMFSPANSLLTNPAVMAHTVEENGRNLINGAANAWDDALRFATHQPPAGAEAYTPGDSVATTPGQVVYRNELMELIQYRPATDYVQAEPILITPAWIMKYYILDLSPGNSLVRWLVEQGHTVFMISWKNPGPEYSDFGIEAYRQRGIMAALDVVNAIAPNRGVHAVGYCLGGTLLSIAAAAMARDDDDRLASLSLFASLMDFEEAGELELFIDESQVHFLEDAMRAQGYLEEWQMKGTFQLLQSNDLLWSNLVRTYLEGERMPMFDLMAWSTDGTRMPYRMHSEYLRRLYLDNALAQNRYRVGGQPIRLRDIQLPAFVVATQKDHIAPWRSVYRGQLHLGGDVTFVLTSGGHNAGVVSEPGHPHRAYQIADASAKATSVGADTWHQEVPERAGSWWPEWHAWLLEHSGGVVAPPTMGAPDSGHAPLADAPGQYVLER